MRIMTYRQLTRLTLTALLLVVAATMSAQSKWNQRYQDYIDKYKDVAITEMQRYRIPASITLAQGLLESGAGQSALARQGNNHFGIKCHDWTGRKTYHDDDERQECFRAYNTVLESYEDHSKFLTGKPRYAGLFKLSLTDYKGWARGLKSAGYATNPRYAEQLIGIIETYELYKYDDGSYQSPHAGSKMVKRVKRVSADHTVRMCNKNYYVVARQGDTFRSLAKEAGVSYRKLARYNERDKNDVLSEGDIVYLQKKRTKADKSFKGVPHVVKAGESMYDIAQKYGVRLKSLYKKNQLPADYVVRAGDRIRVY